jgi:hypothetical protein
MDKTSKKSGSQNRQEKRRQELLAAGSDPKQRKISFASPTARSDAAAAGAVVTKTKVSNTELNNFSTAQFTCWCSGTQVYIGVIMLDLVGLYLISIYISIISSYALLFNTAPAAMLVSCLVC